MLNFRIYLRKDSVKDDGVSLEWICDNAIAVSIDEEESIKYFAFNSRFTKPDQGEMSLEFSDAGLLQDPKLEMIMEIYHDLLEDGFVEVPPNQAKRYFS